jgi:hypothetical protein
MGNFINDIKWPFSIAMLNYQRVVLVGMHPSISNPWHGLSKTVSLSWIDLQLGPVPRPCCQCRSLGNYLSKIGMEEKRKLCTSPVFGGPNLIWQKKPLVISIDIQYPNGARREFFGVPWIWKIPYLDPDRSAFAVGLHISWFPTGCPMVITCQIMNEHGTLTDHRTSLENCCSPQLVNV